MQVKLNIRPILKRKKESLYWLHKQTGISYNALSKMEKWDTTKIEFTTIEKLLTILQCEIKDLLKKTK
jgi:putative transcriptional regulator